MNMDLNSLRDQVSNLTLYDIKAGVRKVQNAVMNYTEMESKVREATNNEPWGASSSLMQEIANGTHSYQLLNEIMPMIYKRFTDKTAEEWRQIYKSLQLLEFLIKNGSERVIDDARSHLSLLRMLRQFHFIDQNGKDQGVNVRNRAQELAKLLQDVDAIRQERKKARANRNKFGGVEGGMGLGGGMSSSSRYGGFGSDQAEEYGGYSGQVYGDGGGFGGNQSGFSDTHPRGDRFEEYDEGDDATATTRTGTRAGTERITRTASSTKRESAKAKAKEPEQDLFEFGDEPAPAPSTSNGKAPAAPSSVLDNFRTVQTGGTADDDFDDFQEAKSPVTTAAQQSAFASLSPPPAATSTTSSATQFAQPKPQLPQTANYANIFSTASPAPSTASATSTTAPMASFSSPPAQPQIQAYRPSGPNYFTSVPVASTPTTSTLTSTFSQPGLTQKQTNYNSSSSMPSLGKPTAKPAAASSGGGDAFGNLWSNAASKSGVQSKSASQGQGPNLATMAKAKSEAGIWGPSAGASSATAAPSSSQPKPAGGLGGGLDDLLG